MELELVGVSEPIWQCHPNSISLNNNNNNMLARGFLDVTVFVHLEEVEDNYIIFYPTKHTLIGHLLRRRRSMACLSFCIPHHHVLIKWTRGQYQDVIVLHELYSSHKPPPSRHLHCNLHEHLI